MFEIDRIPDGVLALIEQKGYSRDSLCIGAFCDRDRNHLPAQIYLLATSDQLIILEGTGTTRLPIKGKGIVAPRVEKDFVELSVEVQPLSSLHHFRV